MPAKCDIRKMLRVFWTEKRTNESVLMEIGQAKKVLSLRHWAAKQKMMLFGHVMRANGMEKDMMLNENLMMMMEASLLGYI